MPIVTDSSQSDGFIQNLSLQEIYDKDPSFNSNEGVHKWNSRGTYIDRTSTRF